MKNITQKELKNILFYNPQNGLFQWKTRKSIRIKIGKTAGSIDSKGYVGIRINGQMYRAHRLAWLYVYGEFPPNLIDHINRVKTDNRICNLREATSSKNQTNQSLRIDNTSGYPGVSKVYKNNKWRAYIKENGQQIFLGNFDTIEEAVAARNEGKLKFHGKVYA